MIFKQFLSILALSIVPSAVSAVQCTGPAGSIASYIAALPAAQSFCSSKYPVPAVTSTATAPAVTTTTTVATSYVSTTVATNYVNTTVTTSTVTVNTTSTVTATATASTTVFVTTISTTTTTSSETDTAIATATVTVTTAATTVYSGVGNQKRSAPAYQQPGWPQITAPSGPGYGNGYPGSNPVSSAWNAFIGPAYAAAGSICTCIETPRSTTVTVTPTVTKSVTAASTVSITATSTNSLTATTSTTQTLTSTTTTTITSTITSTITNTATATSATTTVTTTTGVTTTTTTTTTATATPPVCNSPNGNTAGAGGCASNCYCDSSTNGVNYCTQDITCNAQCTTNADCPSGSFCSNRPSAVAACGYTICESFDGCTSAGLSKRGLNILGMGAGSREGRVNEARSFWHTKEVKRATCVPAPGMSRCVA